MRTTRRGLIKAAAGALAALVVGKRLEAADEFSEPCDMRYTGLLTPSQYYDLSAEVSGYSVLIDAYRRGLVSADEMLAEFPYWGMGDQTSGYCINQLLQRPILDLDEAQQKAEADLPRWPTKVTSVDPRDFYGLWLGGRLVKAVEVTHDA